MKNPTGFAIIVILLLVGSAILVTTGKIPGLPGFFSQRGLSIDENWLIVYNHKAQYDVWSATEIRDSYNATLISIYTTNSQQFNTTGRNLLFIGGSQELSGKLPWAEKWPTLSVVKPGTYPDVYIDNDGTWANVWIHTPFTNYQMMEDGEWLHDYGFIARGYDSGLNRWVIVAIGYSACSTGAAAKILIEDFGVVQRYPWIVYEIPKEIWNENQNVDLWRPDLFQPKLIAHG